MLVGAIIQARMSSQRYPGKVLHEIAGKNLLQFLLERLEHCQKLDSIIIATSVNESDDAIEKYATQNGVLCFRGELNNVASRFMGALDKYGFERFVRINADSPLLDPALIQLAINKFNEEDVEIVTNTLERSFPRGQSVEVINTETFRRGYKKMKHEDEFEHITQFFYKNKHDFKIHNFKADKNYSDIHLGIDTKDDMNTFSAIINKMEKPHWNYGVSEILDIYHSLSKE